MIAADLLQSLLNPQFEQILCHSCCRLAAWRGFLTQDIIIVEEDGVKNLTWVWCWDTLTLTWMSSPKMLLLVTVLEFVMLVLLVNEDGQRIKITKINVAI